MIEFHRRRQRTATTAGGEEGEAALLERSCEEMASGPAASEIADDLLLLQRRAVGLVLESCREETRRPFLRAVVGGERPAEVAKGLGMTAEAVHVAKSQILRRIRDEFEGRVGP